MDQPTHRYRPDGSYSPLVIRSYMLALMHAATLFDGDWQFLNTFLLGVRRQLDNPDSLIVLPLHEVARVARCATQEAGDMLAAVAAKLGLPVVCSVITQDGEEYAFTVDFRVALPSAFYATTRQRNRLKAEIDWFLGKRRPIPEDRYCRSLAMLVILRSLARHTDGTLEVDEFKLSDLLGASTGAVMYALTILQTWEVITVSRTKRRSLVIRFLN